MIRRNVFAAAVVGAVMAFAAATILAQAPASASVMGEDECEGLGVHAAWLDWGTGKVSVAVFNHTGDGRWPARTKTFRIAYQDGGPAVASATQTLRSLNPVNVELFNYKKLVGDNFGNFNGEQLLASGKIRLIECASAR
jgi:hypothetical protein